MLQVDNAGTSSEELTAISCLLELPEACLHRIISFMDAPTKQAFFRVSKGSTAFPGCAALVLAACHAQFTRSHKSSAPAAPSASLLWAAQLSKNIALDISCSRHALHHVLDSLLVFQDGAPSVYPGITSLALQNMSSPCLVHELLPAAFPGLECCHVVDWEADWELDTQPVGPVQQQGLPNLQRLVIAPLGPWPRAQDIVQHISQQLQYLPALTSLHAQMSVLAAVPAPVLNRLTNLGVIDAVIEVHRLRPVLSACTQLQCLTLKQAYDADLAPIMACLRRLAPHIRELSVSSVVTDTVLTHLLALPHLTALNVQHTFKLSRDYSTAPCRWRRLTFTSACYELLTKLPLHTLDHPVLCSTFMLCPSTNHAADMAAIRAAQPHLIKCGGISPSSGVLSFDSFSHTLTKQQATELLQAWAPCLPVLEVVKARGSGARELVQEAVASLWPHAQLT